MSRAGQTWFRFSGIIPLREIFLIFNFNKLQTILEIEVPLFPETKSGNAGKNTVN